MQENPTSSKSKVEIAAKVIVAMLFLLGIFQFALILGAPLGRLAWGGQNEVLPTAFRLGSVSSIIIYIIISLIMLDRARVRSVFKNKKVSYVGAWVLTGYFFLGIFLNAASRSLPERYVQTPVVLILFLLMLYVARYEK